MSDLDIADGFAQIISDATIGVYRADGSAFAAGEIGIVLGELPDEPAQAIGLTPYPVSDNPAGTDGILGLQIMFRGEGVDVRPVWQMRDATFALLQGRMSFTVNGQYISSIWRQISAPLGRDDLGRYEHADTYYLNINRPPSAYQND